MSTHKVDGHTLAAKATGSSDTVQVVLGLGGQVEVNDQGHLEEKHGENVCVCVLGGGGGEGLCVAKTNSRAVHVQLCAQIDHGPKSTLSACSLQNQTERP